MKKSLRFVLAVVVLLVVAGLTYEVRASIIRSQFRGERFGDIKPGMTRTEVEALLGAPPGDYASGGHSILAYGVVFSGGVRREVWIDDAHMYEVHYTAENTVAGAHVRDNLLNAQRRR